LTYVRVCNGTLALAHDLRACWSKPVRARSGEVLGTFALYHSTPRILTHDEMTCMDAGLHLAALAIERQRDEAASRQRESQLRTIFDQALVGIMHRDMNNRVLMINQQFCHILGRTKDEIDGVSLMAFTHPEDALWNEPVVAQHNKTGEPIAMEKRYVRPDGSSVWCAVQVSTVRGAGGNHLSEIVVAQDITQRKLAEEKAHEAYSLLQDVIDSIEDEIFVKDSQGRFVVANQKFGGSTLLGKTDQDVVAAGRAESYRRGDHHVLTTGQPLTTIEATQHNGALRQCHTVKVPLRRKGSIVGVIGVARDITERLQFEEELRESKCQLATLINNLPGVIYRCAPDPPWPVTLMSEGADNLTGYPATDFIAGSLNWSNIVHPDDLERLEHAVSQANEEQRQFSAEYRIVTRLGDVRWVLERGQLIYDATGSTACAEGLIIDITRQKLAEERIRWRAEHDALTQIPNRVLFSQRLEEGVEQSIGTGRSLGLLFLDIDYLKQVNDTLGHSAGDALLREVATRLRGSVRSWDTVSRNGGDEFAVILPDIDGVAELNDLITGVLDSLKRPFSYGGRSINCQASIGASIWPSLAADAPDLQKQADLALQAAKSSGRGKAMLFELGMRAEAQRRTSMLSHARRAVEERRIEPFYQPKVLLSTGKLAGFEALLRWRNPRGTIETPAMIQAAFEDAGLAIAMGEQMHERVIRDMRQWLDAGIEFGHVAINASATEFRSGTYAEQLLERLQSAGIPAQCLEVEVTETVFLGRGAEHVEQALRTLHAAGVRIALDDFGTGYASLSHLKQFPVDVIKIDRSFVQDLATSPEDTTILMAILSLGRGLGLTTVAEGVETAAQAGFLQVHGCELGQGYFFAEPGPKSFVAGLVSSWAKGRKRHF
jgi:diguanylate cyclase (GGDEF)-like protein/PAS domain S-box-containing protein